MIGHKTVWIRRFGGVVQNAIPEQIPLGMFADALNYELTSDGGLHPRLGYKLYAAAAAPDGKPIRTIFAADFDGVIKLLVATSHHVYFFVKSSDTWTSIYTITNTTAARMSFCLLNAATAPVVVFGNGADALQKWNGTTTSACTGAPIGRPIAFKNYVCVFDIPDHPGRVQFAVEHGDPDVWSYGGQIKTLEMRGKITSAFSYAGGLVVFTETRTEMFVGDPDYAQSMNVLSETVGCAAHETVCDCQGMLVWLSQAGVIAWNGAATFPTTNLSDPDTSDGSARSRVQRDVDRIAWSSRDLISAYFDPARKKYHLFAKLQASLGGEVFWRCLVYDFKYGAWFPWDLEGTAAETFIDSSTGRQTPLIGTFEGTILTRSTEVLTDAAVGSTRGYDYWARSGDYDFEMPNHEKIFREVIFAFGTNIEDTSLGPRTITIALRGEFDRISAADASVVSETGGFVLDVTVLGSELAEGYRFSERMVRVAIKAKHINWRFFGSGSGNAVNLTSMAFSFRPVANRSIMTKIL